MNRNALLFLALATFFSPLFASDSIEKVALSFSEKLKKYSTVGRDASIYAFAPGIESEYDSEENNESDNLAIECDPLESVRKRASQWRELYFRDQDRFKVVEVKQQGDLAAVLLSSRYEGSPFQGLIHPICMVKQNEHWKIAPMISNFTFADRPLGKEGEKQVQFLLEWIRSNASVAYDKHVDIDRKAFQKKIDQKKSEIRKSVKDSNGLVDYFLQQVQKGSLEGVCAATGYDTEKRFSSGQDGDLLLKSFVLGMNAKSIERGGWKIITAQDAAVLRLKSIAKDKEGSDKVIYSFISPQFNNLCQVACFKASFSETGFKIQLPSELVARLSDDKVKFYSSEFERWNLEKWMQVEWDNAPEMVMKSDYGLYSESIKEHLETLDKAKKDRDFKTWLSCHIPFGGVKKEIAKDYLESVCYSFKRSKSKISRYTDVGMHSNKEGNLAVSFSVGVNYSEPEKSNAKFVGFKKGENGWGIIPTEFDLSVDELIKKFGVDSSECIKKFLVSIEDRIVEVDPSMLFTGKLKKEEVTTVAQTYFEALSNADFYKAASFGCEVRKDKDDIVEKFFNGADDFSVYENITIEQVKLSNDGVAVVLVKREYDKGSKLSVHFIINSDNALKVDCSHHFELGKGSGRLAQRLNEIKFRNLEKVYPDSVVIFFKKAYDDIRSSIK